MIQQAKTVKIHSIAVCGEQALLGVRSNGHITMNTSSDSKKERLVDVIKDLGESSCAVKCAVPAEQDTSDDNWTFVCPFCFVDEELLWLLLVSSMFLSPLLSLILFNGLRGSCKQSTATASCSAWSGEKGSLA